MAVEQHWSDACVVDISQLNNMDDPDLAFRMTQMAEEYIGRDFARCLGTEVESITVGYNPEYDVKLKDGTLLELKITSNGGLKFFVETDRLVKSKSGDNVLINSGLSLSKSDYYVIGQKDYNDNKLKLKSLLTSDLVEYSKKAERVPHHEGSPSYGFWIDFRNFADGFDALMGTYAMDDDRHVRLKAFINHKGKNITEARNRHQKLLLEKYNNKVHRLGKILADVI